MSLKDVTKFDWILIAIIYSIFSFLYIYPGGVALLQNKIDIVMSDGSDIVGSPYLASSIINLFKTIPSQLFFGAVNIPQLSAPDGYSLWWPGIDRIFIILSSFFIVPEQISSAIVLLSMIFNGVATYALGKILGINRFISFGMGFSWAFNAYVRARAKVHTGFVGIYHLPLIFLGLFLVFKRDDKKSLAVASFCIFIAALVPLYYVVTLAFLSPLFLYFSYLLADNKPTFLKSIKRLPLALLPAFVWLTFSVTHPIPSIYKTNISAFPNTGEVPQGYNYHPYLDIFGSHPIDFFTGDIGIGFLDINPFRQYLNEYVYHHPEGSNPHERTNGVRWSLWFLSAAAFISFRFKNKFIWNDDDKKIIKYFLLFGTFCFFLSMSPFKNFYELSPSYWLFKLVSQIRVPNRAGIGVHFSTVLISGIFLKNIISNIKSEKKIKWINFLFPLILLLDFPPLYLKMPMSPVLPRYEELYKAGSECGYGMQFPYSSTQIESSQLDHFMQRMRGSACLIVNAAKPSDSDKYLASSLGLTPSFIKELEIGDFRKLSKLKYFVNCVPLSWIVIHDAISVKSQEKICSLLGWTLKAQGVCRAENLNQPIQSAPNNCIYSL